jgi:hypothetical protein
MSWPLSSFLHQSFNSDNFSRKEIFMKASFFGLGFLSCGSLLFALGGCVQDTRPEVPSGAMQVSSGGRIVAFTAPHDGKAYLNDDTDHRVVYSTDMRRDQIMRFDPASDTVRIDGNTAPEGIVNPAHDHSIYFARSEHADRVDVPASSAIDANGNPIPTVRVPIGVQVDVQPQAAPAR